MGIKSGSINIYNYPLIQNHYTYMYHLFSPFKNLYNYVNLPYLSDCPFSLYLGGITTTSFLICQFKRFHRIGIH